MARVLLGVRGMDNEAAAERVQRTLREVRGVSSVDANKDGQATVEYDDAEVTVMDLIRSLRQIGFLAGME
ncbi:MAG TPA: heavy-metal-associated domain-containing protein [Trueperaceae bacterium]